MQPGEVLRIEDADRRQALRERPLRDLDGGRAAAVLRHRREDERVAVRERPLGQRRRGRAGAEAAAPPSSAGAVVDRSVSVPSTGAAADGRPVGQARRDDASARSSRRETRRSRRALRAPRGRARRGPSRAGLPASRSRKRSERVGDAEAMRRTSRQYSPPASRRTAARALRHACAGAWSACPQDGQKRAPEWSGVPQRLQRTPCPARGSSARRGACRPRGRAPRARRSRPPARAGRPAGTSSCRYISSIRPPRSRMRCSR